MRQGIHHNTIQMHMNSKVTCPPWVENRVRGTMLMRWGSAQALEQKLLIAVFFERELLIGAGASGEK